MDVTIDRKLDILLTRVSKVRRWLAAIAILKVIAICLLFASGYIGIYIILDHYLNLGILARITAFVLLISSAGFLLYKLSKLLLVSISYSNAANYIENKNSFNQQLVAAMEYYENSSDYPYSKVLAEQLVSRVCEDSEYFNFDSAVEKWRGYALAAVVFLGIGIVSLYVQHNLAYLKTYMTRLTVPFAAIEPVSTTSLKPLTEDIVAEPESLLKFSAGIEGKLPEEGVFVIQTQLHDSNEIPEPEKIHLKPIHEQDAQPIFETSKFFPETGNFKYRFETGTVHTDWKNIEIREAPEIKSITAEISLPDGKQNYTEQIKNNKLEVIEGSSVKLQVETTSKLDEAKIKELDGRLNTKWLDGKNNFSHTFTVDKQGTIEFGLTDEKGLSNKNVTGLEIVLKTDNPPEFELISPEGDYLATNVSSVPIEFEVKDDFGLNSIQFYLELPDQQPSFFDIPVKPNTKEHKFTHTLEMEEYNLNIGDIIMFYARAEDISTAISSENKISSSEVYFIEIRPYQQYWHLQSTGQDEPSNIPGAASDSLKTILEYTRAFVKKTWALANKPEITSEDRSKLDSIRDDVTYSSDSLEYIRDDPLNAFTDAHKAVINQVLSHFSKAEDLLEQYDASSALESEKKAYEILRKFIIEIDMQMSPPPSGQSVPQEKPDKVKLEESTELSGIEKERVDAEMQKLQQDIEQVEREQKKLKTEFVNFLEQQKEASIKAQAEMKAQQSSAESNKNQTSQDQSSNQQSDMQQSQDSSGQGQSSEQSSDQQSQGSSGQGQSSDQSSDQQSQGSSGQGQSSDQQSQGNSGQGQSSEQSSEQQSQGNSGQGQSSEQSSDQQSQGSSGQGQSSDQSSDQQSQGSSGQGQSSEQSSDQQSQGNSGQGQSSEQSIEQSSDQQSQSSSGQGQSSEQSNYQQSQSNLAHEQARLRMLQAKQAALQDKVEQLKQELNNLPQTTASDEAEKHLDEAIENMEQFQEQMNEARYEPESYNRKANRAVELMDSAQEKLELAEDVIGQSIMGDENEQLAQQAQDAAEQAAQLASSLDESLTEIEREQMLARLESAKRSLERMIKPQLANVSGGGSLQDSGHVLTTDTSKPSDTAREISRKFWSLALELKKQKEQPIEDEPSDVRYYENENEFYENAAKYNQE